ncbi:MAG: class I SAM-dependent methyltransferase [Patescibacteria group bacterium]
MQDIIREVSQWNNYTLLDSGDGEKCESFDGVIVVRPDPLVIWGKNDQKKFWYKADLIFTRSEENAGWEHKSKIDKDWSVSYEGLNFLLRPTWFKHVGLFPEQAANWSWMMNHLKKDESVLNLFAYTGGASLAAAKVGATVVHVDASTPAVNWAKENAQLSGLNKEPIRWIVDDVKKFVGREIRRGNKYDAIIMDPPPFGHGPKNELWKFEDDMPTFLNDCAKLMNPQHGMLILNSYALGYPLLSLEQLVQEFVPAHATIETVELALQENTKRGFFLPAGITVRALW